ncbi:light-harvesting complex-like protein 3 isotype 2, chloroplastic isoform X2 [Durio zibethinus]|uniref:Light-harvesting complex-like protein 3 isotype 2, chloroplastic isoform X2 n=1 Tax=Durio zibethinus TaxID=66656 RepID=A0A6P5WQP3_DURZI|nr:light-harvesting complex-like protein 3 isotype 2, chloroplastic isoform X2 [Durio zibethinus]
MSISMASFSPPPTSFSVKPHFTHKPTPFFRLKRPFLLLSSLKSLPDNGAGVSASLAAAEDPSPKQKDLVLEKAMEGSAGPNGVATSTEVEALSKFEDPRWIGGTWDLKQFQKNGSTDWDAVIDAGRAAMIGFFMAYLVDSLTGLGLVDQMGNFFCKTLLFVAVVGVLLIRKNEDLDNIKQLIEETTFYDKQWQATWLDDTSSNNN